MSGFSQLRFSAYARDLEDAIYQMAMDRLTEKLMKAAGVAQRQTAKIEARADALIARESKIEQRTDDAFSGHEEMLSQAEKGLDAVERALGQMSNLPPLEDAISSAPKSNGADPSPGPYPTYP